MSCAAVFAPQSWLTECGVTTRQAHKCTGIQTRPSFSTSRLSSTTLANLCQTPASLGFARPAERTYSAPQARLNQSQWGLHASKCTLKHTQDLHAHTEPACTAPRIRAKHHKCLSASHSSLCQPKAPQVPLGETPVPSPAHALEAQD